MITKKRKYFAQAYIHTYIHMHIHSNCVYNTRTHIREINYETYMHIYITYLHERSSVAHKYVVHESRPVRSHHDIR